MTECGRVGPLGVLVTSLVSMATSHALEPVPIRHPKTMAVTVLAIQTSLRAATWSLVRSMGAGANGCHGERVLYHVTLVLKVEIGRVLIQNRIGLGIIVLELHGIAEYVHLCHVKVSFTMHVSNESIIKYIDLFKHERIIHKNIIYEFILDGIWSSWQQWAPCPVTCGFGITSRDRQCNNPIPSLFGHQCEGHDADWQVCYGLNCPSERR
ncbi:TSP2-like protein [Mya arenaria]|uniref:TSP2-like protein n=1 Tax=Mya arenaria TaxID=6604 RepID=A0ABY7G9U2_MYAAR|nr:TSP2-like protein [Mya arenaria]